MKYNNKQWSQFTIDNMKLFHNKIKLDNDNILLETIKNERAKIVSYSKNLKIKIKISIIDNNNNIIKEYSKVSWVDMKGVHNELDTLDTTYLVSWNNNKIIIRTTKQCFENIRYRLKIIVAMIEYLKFKSDNMEKNATIYLVLTQLKKTFPTNNIIGIKNANTGYTDLNTNIIFVWRYEEFEKVLFHELIHFFDMDTRTHDFDDIIDAKGINPSYYEVFTDFWGIVYNIIFLSLVTKIKIKTLLELELSFIQNQAMILNKHFKLHDWYDKPKKIINQKSPAFSYYILKYMLFMFALENDIMKYLLQNKTNELLKELVSIGFVMKPYINIKSSRMTLMQLK
jgi:hypothetical protein